MVAYSFQQMFRAPILAGTKRQTIRPDRKGCSRHAHPGDVMQLYTGMRTKYCRKIGDAICESVQSIRIQISTYCLIQAPGLSLISAPANLDKFARSDGFEDWAAMRAFWEKHHPGISVFSGNLIRWTGFKTAHTPETDAAEEG